MDKERATELFIAETLKENVELFLDNQELSEDDKEILLSLLSVISYYSLHPDYDAYYAQKKELIDIALGSNKVNTDGFTVTVLTENPDGSSDIEVECGSELRTKVFGEGINFLLIKVILEATTDDILRWAELGKQQEKTDRLVDAFNEIYNEDTK
jgi:hypothetical protein